MTGMASLQALERRILALEARLADVEGGYGDTLYKLHRASVKADLRTARILERLEIEDVSDEDIDNALDYASLLPRARCRESWLSRHRCGSDLAMRTVEGLVERGFRDTP